MIRIVATFRVRPNAVKKFRTLVGELMEVSRAEDGNFIHDPYAARDDSASLAVLEARRNDATIEAHNASAHFTTLMSRMVGFCAEPPSVVQYTEV